VHGLESTRPCPSYLTVHEAAEQLRCSELTIRRRIAEGQIPAVKLGFAPNSGLRIPSAGLEAWLWSNGGDDAAR
jgi:excisionase family DNA binding protein